VTQAILHLKNVRPELSERLPALPEKPKHYGAMTKMDCTPAQEILGLKFKSWQQIVEETVDKLVEMEKAWQA
jgi:dTDP-4-dehydrorhamnose reductase